MTKGKNSFKLKNKWILVLCHHLLGFFFSFFNFCFVFFFFIFVCCLFVFHFLIPSFLRARLLLVLFYMLSFSSPFFSNFLLFLLHFTVISPNEKLWGKEQEEEARGIIWKMRKKRLNNKSVLVLDEEWERLVGR